MSTFERRHIGSDELQTAEMLKLIGSSSLDALIDDTIPTNIRLAKDLDVNEGISEYEYLKKMQGLASKNKVFKSFLGLGYYGTIVPSVILRNVLENPGWYTAYTPYQAEISQGRLEALLNFQTMILDLTKMELANASLLDEATAAAEAMIMFYNLRSRQQSKAGVNKFFVADSSFPQTLDVINGRAENLGIEVVVGDWKTIELDDTYFGAHLQYPDMNGEIYDYSTFVEKAKTLDIKTGVAADIMALVVLDAPGNWGADAVYGSSQRFGVPMGYGGPHAAFFATKEAYKRQIPGRIIGVSVDADGSQALRMALQTREQHIKRDKATSNICTAQALLAEMAGFYATFHGPKGLKNIAMTIHYKVNTTVEILKGLGYEILTTNYFDTIRVGLPDGKNTQTLKAIAEGENINFRYINDKEFALSFSETITVDELDKLNHIFSKMVGKNPEGDMKVLEKDTLILKRDDEILTHEVFNKYHSETEMMRYLKHLENKDISLVHSMISLGSCTMKLNAATELMPITWPEFANLHPFAPVDQASGYFEIFKELERDLAEITGFAGVSLQPNSGAQGEYAGLMVIKAYHEANGDDNRNIVLIPSSAHGTNPASAVMAGMKVVVVKCDEGGNIDVADLKEKCEKHSDNLAAFMVTYPSTHGVFETAIIEATDLIHKHGGQVYMDGANMNAQVGLTNPGRIGADVCHLNLHKTFAIPHGGGGPGMGPIGVAEHLVPFLPGNPLVTTGGKYAINAISAAPYGSALILLISYGYIKLLGAEGLKNSTKKAILHANYLKAKLSGHYDVLYKGEKGNVAHEMIVDCRSFKKTAGVEVADIAKRLIDYGFHAPTVSFPVAGTLMIEPTESENLEELDRFAEAMIKIRQEIAAIENGEFDQENNLLKNSPHTAMQATADEWDFPYTRSQAVYPLPYLRSDKYWVPVRRVDNAYGDRNLICSCTPIEAYAE